MQNRTVSLVTLLAVLFSAHSALAKLSVVTTTSDFGVLARQIGGDQVEVFTIARPTEDPHFVDAKPSYVVKLNRADVLIEGGAELESAWLGPLLEKARNAKIAPGKPGRVVGSEGVHLLEIPTTLDRSQGDVHGGGNPHYLADPLNAKTVATHIANAFSQLDPKSQAVYRANVEKFTREIDEKIKQWEQAMAPHEGKRVVAYHNAWPYFASRFGVKIDLFLEPKPGIPPSASHLSSVVSTMKAEQINLIVVEPFRDRRYAETAAKHAGAVVLDVSPFAGGKGAETYVAWMDQLVNGFAKALSAKK